MYLFLFQHITTTSIFMSPIQSAVQSRLPRTILHEKYTVTQWKLSQTL